MADATLLPEAETVLTSIRRDLNCLADEDRATRRRSAQKLLKLFTGNDKPSTEAAAQLLEHHVLKPCIKLLADPVEKCRELGCDIIMSFVERLPTVQTSLPYIIPAITARLGTPTVVEPTEEIREQLMQLLIAIAKKDGERLAEFIDELALILQRCFADPYPDLKKSTSSLATVLSTAIPRQMTFHGVTLCKALVGNLTHQQYKVRLCTVQALGAVLPCGAAELVEELVNMFQNLVTDRNNSVRAAIVKVVAEWLRTLHDRYSYQHHLLPVLLVATNDDIPSIAESAVEAIETLGKQYCDEHAEDEKWKEKMDYGVEEVLDVELPAPFNNRPSVGARAYVREKLSAMIPSYLRRVSDWTKDSRVLATGVLQALIVYAERHIVAHLEAIIAAVTRVAKDDEVEVQTAIHKAVNLLGQYVDPSAYCHILLPQIRGVPGAAASQRTNAMSILASLVQGSAKAGTLRAHVKEIATDLGTPAIIQSEDTTYVSELIGVVNALIQGVGTSDSLNDIAYPLFSCLVQVQCSQHHVAAKEIASQAVTGLATTLGLPNADALYAQHFDALLSDLLQKHALWTKVSNERFAFDAIVRSAGSAVAPRVPDLIPVFLNLTGESRDAEVRFGALELLTHIIEQPSLRESFLPFASKIIEALIVPSMAWKAGRTAATIRHLCVLLIRAMFAANLITADTLRAHIEGLIPVLVSALEDDLPACRKAMCDVAFAFTSVYGSELDYEQRRHYYPELLKRLDDSDDSIRIAVAPAIGKFVATLPADYSEDHYGRIVDGLLVHLDDPSSDVQAAVAQTVKDVGQFNKGIAHAKVTEVRPRLRNYRDSEALLAILS